MSWILRCWLLVAPTLLCAQSQFVPIPYQLIKPAYGGTTLLEDFDQDGTPDVMLLGNNSNDFTIPERRFNWYENTGHGVYAFPRYSNIFANAYGALGRQVVGATADLDSDGDLDLLSSTVYQLTDSLLYLAFFRRNATGQFLLDTTVRFQGEPSDVAIVD